MTTRRVVERRLQRPPKSRFYEVLPGCGGLESPLVAQPFEPARARADMADFVAIDALQNPCRRFVASGAEALDGGRRDVETPRLEHHRDDRDRTSTRLNSSH